ncbi:MAG: DJ-1/PfpI family protein [Caldilineaceae bacterium]|nr:DJ-1/PfpI family protein [Caldilineaceae bacterium]
MTERTRRTVAILIFPDVELLDFAGPFEVFSSVRAVAGTRERLLDVFTVAESMAPVACNNPLTVLPMYTLATMPHADILVIPGGQGTRTAIDRPDLIAWIVARAAAAELTTSVCTGSFLLAKGGLLDGKATTTHWASIERMRAEFPGLEVREATRWVDAGDVVSSSGVSAGIDMALHVVARLYGAEVAAETARNIEYDYWE